MGWKTNKQGGHYKDKPKVSAAEPTEQSSSDNDASEDKSFREGREERHNDKAEET